jgi:D-Tyr-tRNAtyr deacylase
MRVVIQRVSEASVSIKNKIVSNQIESSNDEKLIYKLSESEKKLLANIDNQLSFEIDEQNNTLIFN